MLNEILLQTTKLSKRYGDVTVLRDVSIDVRRGEIHALLGANGAGKSTLCKIVSGLTPASAGEMKISGETFKPQSKQDAESAGVEMVQQELNLIGTISVAENLFLSRLPNKFGLLNNKRIHNEARHVLDQYGLKDVGTRTPVGSLGVGRQQMVEIAAALARECKLLILDEPTAALSGTESELLFEHLRVLRDQGVGIIYISHRLDEVVSLTDRVTILRDGEWVATESTAKLDAEAMVDLMSGDQQVSESSQFKSFQSEAVALRVDNLRCGMVDNVSFEVKRGQKFGITGLVGSGRTELLRAIFGADVAESGEVFVGDGDAGQQLRHPNEAVAAGLAMVTEDRKDNGLLLSQSVACNTTLASLFERFARFGWLDIGSERDETEALVRDLDTQCQSIDQAVGKLSGGNQQKVAIAKWLLRDADVFLFDEPTRGIDVAARKRIYRLLDSLVSNHKACVIVSSDLEELFETCDYIGVMCEGRLVEVFQRSDWSREQIMQASFARSVA